MEKTVKTTINVIDIDSLINIKVKWQESLKNKLAEEKANLKFDYTYGLKSISADDTFYFRMNIMAYALALWSFIRQEFTNHDNWKLRQHFLAWVRNCDKPMRSTLSRSVINIESLPTIAWRKILWKENINFDSFESCLRRLSDKQKMVLVENAADFVYGKIPRIFSKVDIWLKKINHDSLLTDIIDPATRYLSKGTMSYNLLDLDFGFNAYPLGENNDEKIKEVSPLKFLSVKNHADDFIVNQEHGKYWWLYQKARSNFAFCPNKSVELKTHICPGFWYTFFVHLMFWIISPICAVISYQHNVTFGLGVYWWFFLAFNLPGLITPLWLLITVIKKLILTLPEVDEEKMQAITMKISTIVKKHWRKVVYPIGGAIAFLVFGVVMVILVELLPYIYQHLMYGGLILFAWLITMFIVGIYLKHEYGEFFSFSNLSEFSQYIFWTLLISGLVCLILDFAKQILGVLFTIFNWCWNGIAWIILTGGWPLLSTILFVGFVLLVPFMIERMKNKKRQIKLIKAMEVMMMIVGLLFTVGVVGVFTWSIIFMGIQYLDTLSMLVLVLIFSAGIILLTTKFSLYKHNPEVQEYYLGITQCSSMTPRSWMPIRYLIMKMSENEWLNSLTAVEKEAKTQVLMSFLNNFVFKNSVTAIIDMLVPKLDANMFERIKGYDKEYERNIRPMYWIQIYSYNTPKYVQQIICAWINGQTLLDAVNEAHDKYQKMMDRQFQKIKDFFYNLSWPFRKLWEILVTFKRLYELFNKRCPYVAKHHVLYNE